MSTQGTRLLFVDVSRTYAVFLALLAHFLTTVGARDPMILQFTRMATPMFVFMFGFMVEYVYVSRASQLGQAQIRRRLWTRSFHCYIAYAITGICAVVGGFKSLGEFFETLVFLENSRFGNILRAYTVMMLVAPLIIRLRISRGDRMLWALLAMTLVGSHLLQGLRVIDFGLLGRPLNILFGIGTVTGGPSVFGSFVFFFAGMIAAAGLRESGRDQGLRRFFGSLGSLALFFAISAPLLISEMPIDAWKAYVYADYRVINHPAYFIIGVLCTLAVFGTIAVLFGRRTSAGPFSFLLVLGTSSLVSYTAGNAVLNLFGKPMQQGSTVLVAAAFFVSVLLITRYLHLLPYYDSLRRLLNPGARSARAK